ncbi:hypothetical protein [Marinobacter xiaoshiensis]|uniref:Uncharacterized protein n=1 Tax=Marinobacter xiaoshiensis TaxID=3073652 RepID=A0ABU2HHF7_9GAMM|nr:hypothetical protein [Marinobacter sp. F60267]MDS1310508.1 hypothetical protein [Marinobacter sp. F60267]
MINSEIEKWIQDSAKYLREKQSRDVEFEGRELGEGQSQTLRDEIKLKLEVACQKAKALQDALYPLVMQAQNLPFNGMEKHIAEANDAACKTWVACTLALNDTLPRPRSRAMQYHQAAARLAVAMDRGRAARGITKRIIEESGLGADYSEQSLDNWLREARKDPMT